VSFVKSESGKPALAGPALQAPISFNVSHSGRLALFAFARGCVGVDVELDRRPIDEAALARRAFSPGAARRIATLAPAGRREEFLREWARHEAALKCLGVGIGAATRGRATADAGAQPLWLCDLRLPARGAAALACDTAPLEVCCWTRTAVG
jgi:4'-phosphopantetheinyl transferase